MKRKSTTPPAQGFVLCGRCGRDVRDGAKWFKAHDKVCGMEMKADPTPEPEPVPAPPAVDPNESPAARALREKMLKYAAKFSVDLLESLKPRG